MKKPEKNLNDTEKNPSSENEKKKFSLSALWKNKRTRPILLSAIIILLCAAIYLVLILTILKPAEEATGGTLKYPVYEKIEVSNLLNIRVENEAGGYHYYYDEENDTYYFEALENWFYDDVSDTWMQEASEDQANDIGTFMPNTMALTNFAANPIADMEILDYDKENLAQYGLDNRGKATMTVTYKKADGTEGNHVLYVGKETPFGAGSYYCMLEGKEAVYILSSITMVDRVFMGVKEFLYPQVALAVPSANYMEAENLTIKKHGEEFLSLRAVTDEEYESNSKLYTHVFTNPEGYYPSPDNLEKVFSTFITFVGEEVVEYGLTERMKQEENAEEVWELFRQYSLVDQDQKWNYELTYSYPKIYGAEEVEGEEKKLSTTTLYISDRLAVESEDEAETEEFVYYVYSVDFDVIVEFKEDDLPWVQWDLLTFLENKPFAISIDNVLQIDLSYDGGQASFELSGTGNELKVKSADGVEVDTQNFRKLYTSFIYPTIDGYASQEEAAEPILKFKATLRDGTVLDYEFFALTAGKSFYTKNGEGQFYVNRDYVKQIISATNALLKGETVSVQHKY